MVRQKLMSGLTKINTSDKHRRSPNLHPILSFCCSPPTEVVLFPFPTCSLTLRLSIALSSCVHLLSVSLCQVLTERLTHPESPHVCSQFLTVHRPHAVTPVPPKPPSPHRLNSPELIIPHPINRPQLLI